MNNRFLEISSTKCFIELHYFHYHEFKTRHLAPIDAGNHNKTVEVSEFVKQPQSKKLDILKAVMPPYG